MLVLLVEDDDVARRAARIALRRAGIGVIESETGEDALLLVSQHGFDVIALDIGLPDCSGLDVLRKLRARRIDIPVVIVSAQDDTQTKVAGLHQGADDYLTKPYASAELVARVQSAARRGAVRQNSVVTIGQLEIRLDEKKLTVAGTDTVIPLTASEFTLVEALARRLGRPQSKDSLMDHMYSTRNKDAPDPKTIDVFVCKVRRKIKAALGIPVIETAWNKGYVLNPDPAPEHRAKAPISHDPVYGRHVDFPIHTMRRLRNPERFG